MSITVMTDQCIGCGKCLPVCPFGALTMDGNVVEVNDACRLCRLCLPVCPVQALVMPDQTATTLNRGAHQGVVVVAERHQGQLHPVTLELMGKGRELADRLKQKLHVVLIGSDLQAQAEQILRHGADVVWVAEDDSLEYFRIEPYTQAVAYVVAGVQPNILLLAATNTGRSLAPRLAVRFRTGLTADCTVLDVKANGDLVQIRPAFGGSVMAQIITPKHRPQMATVRYKMMEPAQQQSRPGAHVRSVPLTSEMLVSNITVHSVDHREEDPSISDADVVVAVGRGLKQAKDIMLVEELADLLGGQVGVTRPLVENGWADHTQQIGLSGRSIRPKLLLCLGISGAVQFSAGAGSADWVIAINHDPTAPIFNIAHHGLVGDMYEILPNLIKNLKERRDAHVVYAVEG